jgi:hypothetical protein
MLESYFKLDRTLRRLRAEPTGRYIDDFAKTLQTNGYGVWAAQAYLRAAAHLGVWSKRKGVSVTRLDEEVIGEFARHLPSCHCLGILGILGTDTNFKSVPSNTRVAVAEIGASAGSKWDSCVFRRIPARE